MKTFVQLENLAGVRQIVVCWRGPAPLHRLYTQVMPFNERDCPMSLADKLNQLSTRIRNKYAKSQIEK